MRAPAANYLPAATARDYFSSVEALRQCAADAVAAARRPRDQQFAKVMHERATRFGLRAFMTSLQASRLTRLAAQHKAAAQAAGTSPPPGSSHATAR
jgi:hypothetical protein